MAVAPITTGHRVGRPRKNPMDRQEFFGVFARMDPAERERSLDVLLTVHEALKAKEEEQRYSPAETPQG